MSTSNPLPDNDSSGTPPSHGRRRWAAVAAVAVVVSGVVTAVVLVANRDGEAGAPSAATTVATTTTTTTTATTASPVAPTSTTVVTTTSRQPTAATTLGPFLTAAATLDRQLRAAATTINAAGMPWRTISDAVAQTVRAADLAPVANAMPAGLPPDLLRSVVLVYSDLASRRFAMADFSVATTIDPNAHPNNDDLLTHLRNGHAAATRFAGDLAATRALADAIPAVATPAADSREAAEVRVYAIYVVAANGGCDSRGGHVFTELPELVWSGPGGGTIAGIAFTATFGADGAWQVRLSAC